MFYFKGYIDEQLCSCIIDTGSDVSVIRSGLVRLGCDRTTYIWVIISEDVVLLPLFITVASLFIRQQARNFGCCRAEVPGIFLRPRLTASRHRIRLHNGRRLRLNAASRHRIRLQDGCRLRINERNLRRIFVVIPPSNVFSFCFRSPLDNAGRMTSPMWIPPQVSHRCYKKYLFDKYFPFRSLPDVRDTTGIKDLGFYQLDKIIIVHVQIYI